MYIPHSNRQQSPSAPTGAETVPPSAETKVVEGHNWFSRQKKSRDGDDLVVTDEIRQAALLAEGVAHALCNDEGSLDSALSCFRQLQEWPGSEATLSIRQQAAYNEALVFRNKGWYPLCVLMLTELLGDPIPDTGEAPAVSNCSKPPRADLPDAIRYPARLARLAAFSQYTNIDWAALPEVRSQMLLADAEKLVSDLSGICQNSLSAHDAALVRYMYIDALRAAGHVELMSAKNGDARQLYDTDGRPSHLNDANMNQIPSPATQECLRRAIGWLRLCEEFAPDGGLYCDIAESYLLLREYGAAQAFARHATLQVSPSSKPVSNQRNHLEKDPNYERAYYLAAESYFLGANTSLAQKYLSQFGTPTQDRFRARCETTDLPSQFCVLKETSCVRGGYSRMRLRSFNMSHLGILLRIDPRVIPGHRQLINRALESRPAKASLRVSSGIIYPIPSDEFRPPTVPKMCPTIRADVRQNRANTLPCW